MFHKVTSSLQVAKGLGKDGAAAVNDHIVCLKTELSIRDDVCPCKC